jgi:hypothetical protein
VNLRIVQQWTAHGHDAGGRRQQLHRAIAAQPLSEACSKLNTSIASANNAHKGCAARGGLNLEGGERGVDALDVLQRGKADGVLLRPCHEVCTIMPAGTR